MTLITLYSVAPKKNGCSDVQLLITLEEQKMPERLYPAIRNYQTNTFIIQNPVNPDIRWE